MEEPTQSQTTEESSNAGSVRPRLMVAGGLLLTVVLAVCLNTVVATIAHAAGASDDFEPLSFGAYASFTVLGIALGAIGWALIRTRSASPRLLLRFLVPIVLVVSLIPDVIMGFGDRPGLSWGAVAALMVMHVIVAVVAALTFQRLFPLPATSAKATG